MKFIPFYFIISWFVTVFEIVNLYKRKSFVSYNFMHALDTIQLGLNLYFAIEFFGKIDTEETTLLEKIDILNVLEKV